ncbi:DNA-3-methyladenine glycosylase I [Corynebacterium mustelae]|uniref:DNA-3-methyladenine glycosylase I n=1 Tax=Corynebacterium mustelae TaxID=571915 RepID=A0A0G3GY33_9CORY|nr:DNA-3-methyladenine glycosylase I [Corynebacterium mustelae]AKK04453.1 DNA-3-methyladenine glycosylase I [Corynebacterium mustelae]
MTNINTSQTPTDLTEAGLVKCEDNQWRPPWAVHDPLLREYYDGEWGQPITDEKGVFERLCLEGFQAGLSWRTVLNKREYLRAGLCNFNPDQLAVMDTTDIPRIMESRGMVKNHRKIASVLNNAAKTLELRTTTYGDLAQLIWSFAPENHISPASVAAIPTTSPESTAMAAKLKELGFSYVGPTTCYALMQAIGIVDDRVIGAARGRPQPES